METLSLYSYAISVRSRIIAAVMSVIFVLTSLAYVPHLEARDLSALILPAGISIEPSMGNIQTVFYGEKKTTPVVVYIQDAHAQYEAQRNISALIKNLAKEYDLDTVCIEGASGEHNVSLVRAFPFEGEKADVVDTFVKKGMITGAEASAITAQEPIALVGIDHQEKYQQNLALYLTALKIQHKALAAVSRSIESLRRLRLVEMNEELRSFISIHEAFYRQQVQPLAYTRSLLSIAKKYHLRLRAYPSFKKLQTISIYQERIDVSQLENERRAFVESCLLPVLTAEESHLLACSELDFRSNRCDALTYYRTIRELARIHALDLRAYKNLNRYYYYLLLVQDIDAAAIERERVHVEAYIARILARTDREKELFHYGKVLHAVEKVFRLKAIPEEVDLARKNTSVLSDVEKKYMPLFESFYALAEKREDTFIKKTLHSVHRTRKKAIILVAGGYHRRGIEQRFKEKRVSFITVSPRLTHVSPDALYEKIMQSYDAYFGVNEGEHAGTVALFSPFLADNPELAQKFRNEIVPVLFDKIKALKADNQRIETLDPARMRKDMIETFHALKDVGMAEKDIVKNAILLWNYGIEGFVLSTKDGGNSITAVTVREARDSVMSTLQTRLDTPPGKWAVVGVSDDRTDARRTTRMAASRKPSHERTDSDGSNLRVAEENVSRYFPPIAGIDLPDDTRDLIIGPSTYAAGVPLFCGALTALPWAYLKKIIGEIVRSAGPVAIQKDFTFTEYFEKIIREALALVRTSAIELEPDSTFEMKWKINTFGLPIFAACTLEDIVHFLRACNVVPFMYLEKFNGESNVSAALVDAGLVFIKKGDPIPVVSHVGRNYMFRKRGNFGGGTKSEKRYVQVKQSSTMLDDRSAVEEIERMHGSELAKKFAYFLATSYKKMHRVIRFLPNALVVTPQDALFGVREELHSREEIGLFIDVMERAAHFEKQAAQHGLVLSLNEAYLWHEVLCEKGFRHTTLCEEDWRLFPYNFQWNEHMALWVRNTFGYKVSEEEITLKGWLDVLFKTFLSYDVSEPLIASGTLSQTAEKQRKSFPEVTAAELTAYLYLYNDTTKETIATLIQEAEAKGVRYVLGEKAPIMNQREALFCLSSTEGASQKKEIVLYKDVLDQALRIDLEARKAGVKIEVLPEYMVRVLQEDNRDQQHSEGRARHSFSLNYVWNEQLARLIENVSHCAPREADIIAYGWLDAVYKSLIYDYLYAQIKDRKTKRALEKNIEKMFQDIMLSHAHINAQTMACDITHLDSFCTTLCRLIDPIIVDREMKRFLNTVPGKGVSIALNKWHEARACFVRSVVQEIQSHGKGKKRSVLTNDRDDRHEVDEEDDWMNVPIPSIPIFRERTIMRKDAARFLCEVTKPVKIQSLTDLLKNNMPEYEMVNALYVLEERGERIPVADAQNAAFLRDSNNSKIIYTFQKKDDTKNRCYLQFDFTKKDMRTVIKVSGAQTEKEVLQKALNTVLSSLMAASTDGIEKSGSQQGDHPKRNRSQNVPPFQKESSQGSRTNVPRPEPQWYAIPLISIRTIRNRMVSGESGKTVVADLIKPPLGERFIDSLRTHMDGYVIDGVFYYEDDYKGVPLSEAFIDANSMRKTNQVLYIFYKEGDRKPAGFLHFDFTGGPRQAVIKISGENSHREKIRNSVLIVCEELLKKERTISRGKKDPKLSQRKREIPSGSTGNVFEIVSLPAVARRIDSDPTGRTVIQKILHVNRVQTFVSLVKKQRKDCTVVASMLLDGSNEYIPLEENVSLPRDASIKKLMLIMTAQTSGTPLCSVTFDPLAPDANSIMTVTGADDHLTKMLKGIDSAIAKLVPLSVSQSQQHSSMHSLDRNEIPSEIPLADENPFAPGVDEGSLYEEKTGTQDEKNKLSSVAENEEVVQDELRREDSEEASSVAPPVSENPLVSVVDQGNLQNETEEIQGGENERSPALAENEEIVRDEASSPTSQEEGSIDRKAQEPPLKTRVQKRKGSKSPPQILWDDIYIGGMPVFKDFYSQGDSPREFIASCVTLGTIADFIASMRQHMKSCTILYTVTLDNKGEDVVYQEADPYDDTVKDIIPEVVEVKITHKEQAQRMCTLKITIPQDIRALSLTMMGSYVMKKDLPSIVNAVCQDLLAASQNEPYDVQPEKEQKEEGYAEKISSALHARALQMPGKLTLNFVKWVIEPGHSTCQVRVEEMASDTVPDTNDYEALYGEGVRALLTSYVPYDQMQIIFPASAQADDVTMIVARAIETDTRKRMAVEGEMPQQGLPASVSQTSLSIVIRGKEKGEQKKQRRKIAWQGAAESMAEALKLYIDSDERIERIILYFDDPVIGKENRVFVRCQQGKYELMPRKRSIENRIRTSLKNVYINQKYYVECTRSDTKSMIEEKIVEGVFKPVAYSQYEWEEVRRTLGIEHLYSEKEVRAYIGKGRESKRLLYQWLEKSHKPTTTLAELNARIDSNLKDLALTTEAKDVLTSMHIYLSDSFVVNDEDYRFLEIVKEDDHCTMVLADEWLRFLDQVEKHHAALQLVLRKESLYKTVRKFLEPFNSDGGGEKKRYSTEFKGNHQWNSTIAHYFKTQFGMSIRESDYDKKNGWLEYAQRAFAAMKTAQAMAENEMIRDRVRKLLAKDMSQEQMRAMVTDAAQMIIQMAVKAQVVETSNARCIESLLIDELLGAVRIAKALSHDQHERKYGQSALAMSLERARTMKSYNFAHYFVQDKLLVYCAEDVDRTSEVRHTLANDLKIPEERIEMKTISRVVQGDRYGFLGYDVLDAFDFVIVLSKERYAAENEDSFESQIARVAESAVSNKVRIVIGADDTGLQFSRELSFVRRVYAQEGSLSILPFGIQFTNEARIRLSFFLLDQHAFSRTICNGSFNVSHVPKEINDQVARSLRSRIMEVFA